jgi:hypothetical protein
MRFCFAAMPLTNSLAISEATSGVGGLRDRRLELVDGSRCEGRVSGTINVRDVIAKKRGGRRIPQCIRI